MKRRNPKYKIGVSLRCSKCGASAEPFTYDSAEQFQMMIRKMGWSAVRQGEGLCSVCTARKDSTRE